MFGYFAYIFSRSETKTLRLFSLAEKDPFFKPLIERLKRDGYDIEYHYWGRPGAFIPRTTKDGRPALPKFRFSYRYGFAIAAHTFLHELVHFKQYHDGTLPGAGTHSDKEAYLKDVLKCEADAQIQALAASWRLKQNGHPQAWNGALLSFDWRTLARAYQKDLSAGSNEDQAKDICLKSWYEHPQRKYYERRAAMVFDRHHSNR